MIEVVTPACLGCGDTAVFIMTEAELTYYRAGEPVQRIFPHWPPEDRERLISGTCPSCWEEMWAEKEEEDDRPDEDEWTDEDLDELFLPYGYYLLLDPESDDPSYESDYYVDRDCD